MFGYFKGKIIVIKQEYIILVVNDVGYKIFLDTSKLEVNMEKEFYIETIVKENEISLYGFENQEQQRMFNQLLLVNGVGPRVAAAVTNHLEYEKFAACVVENNTTGFPKIKGVGPKIIEKIIFELQDKIKKEYKFEETPGKNEHIVIDQSISALICLGYTKEQATKTMNLIYNNEVTLQENIKKALQELKK